MSLSKMIEEPPHPEEMSHLMYTTMVCVPRLGYPLCLITLPTVGVTATTRHPSNRLKHLPNVKRHWHFNIEAWAQRNIIRYQVTRMTKRYKHLNGTYYMFKSRAVRYMSINRWPTRLLNLPITTVKMAGDAFVFSLADGDQELDANGWANYVDVDPDLVRSERGQILLEKIIKDTAPL